MTDKTSVDGSATDARRKAWVAPSGSMPTPTISPESLMAQAFSKVQPESVGKRLFRSVITPPLYKNA